LTGKLTIYLGTFRAWFQTKHATAAFGTRLMVDEIKRIRTEKCEPEAVGKRSDKHTEHFSDFGPLTILPLRDPMTLEVK